MPDDSRSHDPAAVASPASRPGLLRSIAHRLLRDEPALPA